MQAVDGGGGGGYHNNPQRGHSAAAAAEKAVGSAYCFHMQPLREGTKYSVGKFTTNCDVRKTFVKIECFHFIEGGFCVKCLNIYRNAER